MNLRTPCFIEILQPLLGWKNLDRTIAYTRFHRIKVEVECLCPPTNNFDRVDEIQRFLWILLSVTLFQRSLVMGEALRLRLLFCKTVCHD